MRPRRCGLFLLAALLRASLVAAAADVEIRYDGGSGPSEAFPPRNGSSLFTYSTVGVEAPPERAKPLIDRDEVPHQLPDGQLHNWGKSYWWRPAKVIEARTFDDVIRVITDPATYPSPVRAMGNIHSVTEAVVNAGGTVLLMRNLRGVRDVGWNEHLGCHTAVALAGTSLIELYTLLGEKGFEVGFQAEIGDATIGATSVSQTKDSGPTTEQMFGSVYKEVVGVKYADHEGRIVELNRRDHPEQLAAFKCSEGLLGVVLEVTVRCDPQRLVANTYTNLPTDEIIRRIHEFVTEGSNVWMMLRPDNTFVEARHWAKPEEQHTPALCSFVQLTKQLQFQMGVSLFPPRLIRLLGLSFTCYRREQVVKYREPGFYESRQDFSWYEYPMDRWEEIAPAYVQFMRDFAAAHNGFTPTGAAVYFVRRIPEKPHGWFSQQGHGFDRPGISFNLDPVYSNPTDPVWREYLQANTAFALRHGGRLSIIQTRHLNATQFFTAPGNMPLAQAPNRRFTTPFLEQFVAK